MEKEMFVNGETAILYLDVPYSLKDEAKRLGARWDAEARQWYINRKFVTDVNILKLSKFNNKTRRVEQVTIPEYTKGKLFV